MKILYRENLTWTYRSSVSYSCWGLPYQDLIAVMKFRLDHFSSPFLLVEKLLTRSTCFPLHHSRFLWFFKTFAPFLQNSAQFLLIFDRDGRFCKFSSNFRRFFSEFRRISVVLTGVMPRLLYFREMWKTIAEPLLQILWKSVWKNVCSKSPRW